MRRTPSSRPAPPRTLGRREFLCHTTLGLAGGWLAANSVACEAGGAAPGDDALPDALGDGMVPTCGELTEANIEGPFFTPNSPLRADLTGPGLEGTKLEVAGIVYSAATCLPIAEALLDVWSADHLGAYDDVGFSLRGHQFADGEGRYKLTSILPGHYLNGAQYRPAHIHVKVAAAGHRMLTTQLYFAGDPYNDIDPFIRPSLIMEMADVGGVLRATFHFVLAPQ